MEHDVRKYCEWGGLAGPVAKVINTTEETVNEIDSLPVTFVYGLLDPETQEIRYIGKTKDPARRLLNHLCEKTNSKKTKWVKRLKERGLQPELVIFEMLRGKWPWEEAEMFWIHRARKLGWPLFNQTSGGRGAKNPTFQRKLLRGEDHWTRKIPERVARGDNNGSRKHPEKILKGSQVNSSKLTEDDVIEIRRLNLSGMHKLDIAEKYGITRENTALIIRGKSWKHVPLPFGPVKINDRRRKK